MNKNTMPKLRLSNKMPISKQIYQHLRFNIINNTLKPGTIFSENGLATLFNVSRHPVREALMMLGQENLVFIAPQRGSVVQKISIANLRQVCFIRTSIECSSIDNALNINVKTYGKLLEDLKKNIEKQKAVLLKDSNQDVIFLEEDNCFHELLCNFSQCPMTWSVIQSIKGQLDRIRFLSMQESSTIEQLIHEHEEIYDALQKHDFNEAKRLLKTHLFEVMQTHIAIKEHYGEWFLEEDEEA